MAAAPPPVLLFFLFFLSTPDEAGPLPLSLSLPPVKPDMRCLRGACAWLCYQHVVRDQQQHDAHTQPVLRIHTGSRGRSMVQHESACLQNSP